jgi:mRNA-degrading endonuclease RelE of RelBE toxin-antitoxin system
VPKYKISVHRKADKFLDGLRQKQRHHILEDICFLQDFPQFKKPLDIKKMQGLKDTYRLRTDDFRTTFTVDKNSQTIFILKIIRREAAYK